MSDERHSFGLFGIIALLAFLAFLAFLIWQMRQQVGTLTLTEIQRAREIARRLEQ